MMSKAVPAITATVLYRQVSRPRRAAAMQSIPIPIDASPPRCRSARARRRRSLRKRTRSGSQASAITPSPMRATRLPRMRGMVSARTLELALESGRDRSRLKRSSCPRVRLLIHLLEPLDARVGVDLGRGDRRVAEQVLHGAEIGARIEQMRSEGVAQRVDGETRVLVDLVEEPRDDLLHHAHADALSGARQEIRPALDSRAGAAPVAEEVVALRLVVAQGEHGVIAYRHDALLPALPPHLHLLAHQVEIAHAEPLQLGEAHPGRVEELEDGEVAHRGEVAFHRARFGHLEEQIDLRTIEIAGEVLVQLRRADRPRGTGLDHLVGADPAVEAAPV